MKKRREEFIKVVFEYGAAESRAESLGWMSSATEEEKEKAKKEVEDKRDKVLDFMDYFKD